MSQNHPTDLLPSLAIGCLEADESAQVRRHVAGCRMCQAELAAFQEVTDQLAHGAPSVLPSEHLKHRLLARIRPRHKILNWFKNLAVTRPRLIPIAIMTAMIVVIVMGTSNIFLWHQLGTLRKSNLDRIELVRLQGAPTASGASGTLIVNPGSREGLLLINALAPLTSAKQYQLWLIKNGRRTNGGVFSVTAEGKARLTVSTEHPLFSFDALGITIEPFGGSPGPTGRKVLGGQIRL